MAYTDDNPYEDGPAMAKEEMPKEDESDHGSGQVTTIPSSICPGMKAGDDIILHIDQISGKEYVVSYSPEKGKGDGEEEESGSDMKSDMGGKPDSEMASMYE